MLTPPGAMPEGEPEFDAQSSASSVVDRIKSGLKWQIVPATPAVSHSAELQIARSALARLDAERAPMDLLLESINRRIRDSLDVAVFEHGSAALRAEYKEKVEALHATMAKMAALCRMTGRAYLGRAAINLPPFDGYAPPRNISDSSEQSLANSVECVAQRPARRGQTKVCALRGGTCNFRNAQRIDRSVYESWC
jgi:hypothetical protein